MFCDVTSVYAQLYGAGEKNGVVSASVIQPPVIQKETPILPTRQERNS